MTMKSPYAWTAPGWLSEMPSGEPDAEEIWVYADRYSYAPGRRSTSTSTPRRTVMSWR